MAKYLSRRYAGDLYSVSHTGGFACVQESKAACLAKLAALDLTANQALVILNEPVKLADWRSMFAQAAAAEATAATAALESVASVDDVTAVREKQSELEGAVSSLRRELASDRLQQEQRELEAYLDSEAQKCRDALAANRQKLTRFAENFIWQTLWATPAGKRLTELRNNA